jgi:hypothetical protein
VDPPPCDGPPNLASIPMPNASGAVYLRHKATDYRVASLAQMAFVALLSNLTDVELFRMMHHAGPEVSSEMQSTAASEALFTRVNSMYNHIMRERPGWRTPAARWARSDHAVP